MNPVGTAVLEYTPPAADRGPRRLSVFVPAYNEVVGLEGAVRGVLKAAEAVLDECEVLIVDDGSTDGTGELADRLARQDSRIRVFHHPKNLGLGAGYNRALSEARLDYFTFVGGDDEIGHDSIRRIFSMVGAADVVIPYHWNSWDRAWYRRIMTFTCTTMLNVLLGNRIKYYQGPNIYPTAVARILPRTEQGFFFATEMTAYAAHLGYGIAHLGLIHRDRGHGKSKAVTLKNIRRALATIFRLWWKLTVKRQVLHMPADVPPPRNRKRSEGWTESVSPTVEKVAV